LDLNNYCDNTLCGVIHERAGSKREIGFVNEKS